MKLALTLLITVMLFAPSAMGGCIPAKVFHTWDFDDYLYYYVYNFSGDLDTVAGAFWEPGSRDINNEGSYGIDNWLRYYGAASKWYISGNMGDSRVTGCISGELVLLMSDPVGYETNMIVAQADETPEKANHYNLPDCTLSPIPEPRIISMSNTGGDDYTVDLTIDDLSPLFHSRFGKSDSGYLSAINLYEFIGGNDPGRQASSWSLIRTVPYSGGVTEINDVPGSCKYDPATDRQYLAIGVRVTGEYDTIHVGASTPVICNTLADPDDKFDRVRDKGQGRKRGRPFR